MSLFLGCERVTTRSFHPLTERSDFMIALKRSLLPLIVTLLGTYAGATLASPSASHAVRSEGVIVAQAQPDKPVDCKKNPTDPRCEKR
jgi:hypothetical protein